MHRLAAAFLTTLALALAFLPGRAGEQVPPPDLRFLDSLTARPIGPANMGGRVTDIAVVESQPDTMYVATASGGLWKTANRGNTWAPVFDRESVISLGDVAVAPSNPDIVWVGTGEANARNSVSWGDGVYKSTDAGKTWKNMGLKETQHVGRIVIHPKDPDVVYVAALGHVWGPNPERGVFRTSDGGKTWLQVLSIDKETGCIDLAMDPSDPGVLYACMYRVRRDGFSGGNPEIQYSEKAGIYKTTDAGKSWNRLTKGLPTNPLGRIGIDVYRKDPRILYAVVQTDKTRMVRAEELGQAARTSEDPSLGGIFRSDDGGETWKKRNDLCPRPFYFGQIRIDPTDPNRVYVLGVTLHVTADGGKTFQRDVARGTHADHHALWINPANPSHLVLGNDGGIYFSFDRAANFEAKKNLAIGQFYGIAVDMRKPYYVYGGLQDNGSWGGPSATRSLEGVTASDWFRILDGDGFQCQADPIDPDTVYAESQYGGLTRINLRTGARTPIAPAAADKTPAYRFNWSAPILLSPHNPRTLYYGGNHVFRSVDRGDHWDLVSPDLTLGKPGPSDDRGHTLSTIAESPRKVGLLYAGTDDGRVHVTRDGGVTWKDLSDKVPGVPADRHISRVETSRFAEGTAYLAIDRHRQDDRRPYLFRTTDYGATWTSISANLPVDGPVYVVREGLVNRDLLFVGTEFGLFVSLNSGGSWQQLKAGLPTVAVHDLVIHPRDRELVIGTHGRSIWVLDEAPLEEMTPKVLDVASHLFEVKPATIYRRHGERGLRPSGVYSAPNPPFGATIRYYLKEAPRQPAKVTITDVLGNVVITLKGAETAGLHSLQWDLRPQATRMGEVKPLVAPGDYAVRLDVGDRAVVRKLRVEAEE